MSVYDDLHQALAAMVRPREEKPEPSLEDLRLEIRELRMQISSLQRALSMLADVVSQGEGVNPDHLRARIVVAARGPITEAPMVNEDDERAVVETAYRGVTPGQGGDRCSVCRAPLDPEDPETTLEGGARVCFACYRRRS